ncbi:MAG: hypothetical protein KDA57_01660 [Planctomycetales bacterium]|nr:hypothetical protein [Planctomycetales bacterium]
MALLIVFIATSNLALGYALAVYLGHGKLPWQLSAVSLPLRNKSVKPPASTAERQAKQENQTENSIAAANEEVAADSKPIVPSETKSASSGEPPKEELAEAEAELPSSQTVVKSGTPAADTDSGLADATASESPEREAAEEEKDDPVDPVSSKSKENLEQAAPVPVEATESVEQPAVQAELPPETSVAEPVAAESEASPEVIVEAAEVAAEIESAQSSEVVAATPQSAESPQSGQAELEIASDESAADLESQLSEDETDGSIAAYSEQREQPEPIASTAASALPRDDGEVDDKFLEGITAFQAQLAEGDAKPEEEAIVETSQSEEPATTPVEGNTTESSGNAEKLSSKGDEVLAGIESFRAQLASMQQTADVKSGQPAEQPA